LDLLHVGVDSFRQSHLGEGLDAVEFWDQQNQEKWDAATPDERALWVLGHLFACGDIVPGWLYTDVSDRFDFHGRHTYGALVRVLARERKGHQSAAAQ
jgi:hypothetical protein